MTEGQEVGEERIEGLGRLQARLAASDRSYVDVLDVFSESPKPLPDHGPDQCLAGKLKKEELGEDDEETEDDEDEDTFGKATKVEGIEVEEEPPDATSSPIPLQTESPQDCGCPQSPQEVDLARLGPNWYHPSRVTQGRPEWPGPCSVSASAPRDVDGVGGDRDLVGGGKGSETLSGPPSCESTTSRHGSTSGMSPDTTGEPHRSQPQLPPMGHLYYPYMPSGTTKRPLQGAKQEELDFPRDVPKKKGRRQYTDQQVALLEQAFHLNHYPTREDRVRLQAISAVPIEAIKIWFQNRRSRERRRCKAQGVPIPQRTPLPQNIVPHKWMPQNIMPEVASQKVTSALAVQHEGKISSSLQNMEERRGQFPSLAMGWPSAAGRPAYQENKVSYHGNPVMQEVSHTLGKTTEGGYSGHGIGSTSVVSVKQERVGSMDQLTPDCARVNKMPAQSSVPISRPPRIISPPIDFGVVPPQRHGLVTSKNGPGLPGVETRGFPRSAVGVASSYRSMDPSLYSSGYGSAIPGVCSTPTFYGGFPQHTVYPQQLASYYSQPSTHYTQYGNASPGQGNFNPYPYNYCTAGGVIPPRQSLNPNQAYSYMPRDPYNITTSSTNLPQSPPFNTPAACGSAYLGSNATCFNPSRSDVPQTSLTWSSQYPTTSPPTRTLTVQPSAGGEFQPTLPMQRVRQALQDRLARADHSEIHSPDANSEFMQFRLGNLGNSSSTFVSPILNMEPPAPHRTVLPPVEETPTSPSGLDTPPSASPISSEHASTHNSPWAMEYSGFYSALVAHGDSETDTDRTHDESNIHQVSDE